MNEFDLIRHYFNWNQSEQSPDSSNTTTSCSNDNQETSCHFSVVTGTGDDAAVLAIEPGFQIVTSIDTLVCGVHFPEQTPPEAIGYKALAVNLSDLAAMGAQPAWFTLALTLPEVDSNWLESFSHGMKQLVKQLGVRLVGGDTTRGPLTITVQVSGLVKPGKALLRSGASAGDRLYLSGCCGEAAVGLMTLQNRISLSASATRQCRKRLEFPRPRVREAAIIARFASACIDISDGLVQDLTHILEASGAGAKVDIDALPVSPALGELDSELLRHCQLSGGDDYELLFCIPANLEEVFLSAYEQARQTEINNDTVDPDLLLAPVHCIGTINDVKGELVDLQGAPLTDFSGYNHFQSQPEKRDE